MADHGPMTEISLAGRFASSAIAACFAEICTIPLDTAKVRLQLQKKVISGDAVALPKYRGMLGTVSTIAREEGMTALWKGIVPGLHRQCLFGGLQIGLYEVKSLYVGENFVGDIPLTKKILAGLTTGALTIMVVNPTDLVKIRLQAEGKLPPGVPRCYCGALNAYSTILKQEGVGALWTGLGPNIARNAIINAAELASYDQVKQTILKIPGFSDNVFTHLLSGLGGWLFAVCIGSPVDVVKSRMMGDSACKSTLDCFLKTLKNDGPHAFYKSSKFCWNEECEATFQGQDLIYHLLLSPLPRRIRLSHQQSFDSRRKRSKASIPCQQILAQCRNEISDDDKFNFSTLSVP